MAHIFYFFGLIITLMNISLLIQFFKMEKIREWSVKFQKVTSKEPNRNDFKTGEYELLTSYTYYLVSDFIWLFLGLINTDFRICGIILIGSFIVNLIVRKIGEFKPISLVLKFTKLCLITFLIGLMTINHFNLHLDLWKVMTHFQ